MKRINSFAKRWKKALKVQERKSIFSILFEYAWLRILYPNLSGQYFNKYLFRKNAKNSKNYLVTHKLYSDLWDFNSQYSRLYPLLTDKFFFEKFFSGHVPADAKIIFFRPTTRTFRQIEAGQIDTLHYQQKRN